MNRLLFTPGPTGHYVWRLHHQVDLEILRLATVVVVGAAFALGIPDASLTSNQAVLAAPLFVLRCAVCGVRKHAALVL